MAQHEYSVSVRWTGNRGDGTSGYRSYGREHEVTAGSKPAIGGSSDPAFRGDAARWSPEELLVAALSQCHMLWYLHLAAEAGVIVTEYRDDASGTMSEEADCARFTSVTLNPTVTVADETMRRRAGELHGEAHEQCFIARSVNFPVHAVPRTEVRAPGPGPSQGGHTIRV